MKKYISCFILALILFLLALAGFYFYILKPRIDNSANKARITEKIKNLVTNETDFTFAVASDSGRQNDDLNKIYKQIVEKVNKSNAKFFIHLGDFTQNGTDAEFQEFKNYMAKNLNIAYYIVPGNHDILADEQDKSVFLNYYKDLYQSFDYEKNHFVILDNSWNLEGFSDEQLNWLKQDLATNKFPAFIFMHRPTKIPFEDVFDINDGGTKQTFASYDKFYEIINEPKNNVKEVYSGHLHMYFPFNLLSITMTIVGSAGSLPQYDFMKNDDSYYHYFEVNTKGKDHANRMIEIAE
ncbi:MAG: metallophosphoesterase [Patescibacteria group bacterium]|jgi:3',5'-cyclic AMP phosphodiesterase CpdA